MIWISKIIFIYLQNKISKMKREFVPYELALKLKELGFGEPCFAMWTQGWSEFEWGGSMLPRIFSSKFRLNDTQSCEAYANNTDVAFGIAAPTFSQCFKWFREKYQIFPEVLTDCTTEPKFVYTYNTFYGNPKDLTEQEWGWENNIGQYSDIYRTYEDAEIACLENLIELVESKSE